MFMICQIALKENDKEGSDDELSIWDNDHSKSLELEKDIRRDPGYARSIQIDIVLERYLSAYRTVKNGNGVDDDCSK